MNNFPNYPFPCIPLPNSDVPMVPIMVPLQYFQLMTSASVSSISSVCSVTANTSSVTSSSVSGISDCSVDVNITSGRKIEKIGAVDCFDLLLRMGMVSTSAFEGLQASQLRQLFDSWGVLRSQNLLSTNCTHNSAIKGEQGIKIVCFDSKLDFKLMETAWKNIAADGCGVWEDTKGKGEIRDRNGFVCFVRRQNRKGFPGFKRIRYWCSRDNVTMHCVVWVFPSYLENSLPHGNSKNQISYDRKAKSAMENLRSNLKGGVVNPQGVANHLNMIQSNDDLKIDIGSSLISPNNTQYQQRLELQSEWKKDLEDMGISTAYKKKERINPLIALSGKPWEERKFFGARINNGAMDGVICFPMNSFLVTVLNSIQSMSSPLFIDVKFSNDSAFLLTCSVKLKVFKKTKQTMSSGYHFPAFVASIGLMSSSHSSSCVRNHFFTLEDEMNCDIAKKLGIDHHPVKSCRAIITDAGAELANGFSACAAPVGNENWIQIRDKVHFKKQIIRKIKETLNEDSEHGRNFYNDMCDETFAIFGLPKSEYIDFVEKKGLVRWGSVLSQYFQTFIFHSYECFSKEIIRKSGFSEDDMCGNYGEGLHNSLDILCKNFKTKKITHVQWVSKAYEMMHEQASQICSSLCGKGPFVLRDEFQHLSLNRARWEGCTTVKEQVVMIKEFLKMSRKIVLDNSHNTGNNSIIENKINNRNEVIVLKKPESSGLGILGNDSRHVESKRFFVVNPELLAKFEMISTAFLEENKECLGLLGGTVFEDHIKVSALVIPKQTSNTNISCAMENEVQVDEQLRKRDLKLVGWIHLHPSFSAFFSIIDCKTHFFPQAELNDYLGIVYSPHENKVGFKGVQCAFRLTHSAVVKARRIFEEKRGDEITGDFWQNSYELGYKELKYAMHADWELVDTRNIDYLVDEGTSVASQENKLGDNCSILWTKNKLESHTIFKKFSVQCERIQNILDIFEIEDDLFQALELIHTGTVLKVSGDHWICRSNNKKSESKRTYDVELAKFTCSCMDKLCRGRVVKPVKCIHTIAVALLSGEVDYAALLWLDADALLRPALNEKTRGKKVGLKLHVSNKYYSKKVRNLHKKNDLKLKEEVVLKLRLLLDGLNDDNDDENDSSGEESEDVGSGGVEKTTTIREKESKLSDGLHSESFQPVVQNELSLEKMIELEEAFVNAVKQNNLSTRGKRGNNYFVRCFQRNGGMRNDEINLCLSKVLDDKNLGVYNQWENNRLNERMTMYAYVSCRFKDHRHAGIRLPLHKIWDFVKIKDDSISQQHTNSATTIGRKRKRNDNEDLDDEIIEVTKKTKIE